MHIYSKLQQTFLHFDWSQEMPFFDTIGATIGTEAKTTLPRDRDWNQPVTTLVSITIKTVYRPLNWGFLQNGEFFRDLAQLLVTQHSTCPQGVTEWFYSSISLNISLSFCGIRVIYNMLSQTISTTRSEYIIWNIICWYDFLRAVLMRQVFMIMTLPSFLFQRFMNS